ncbi:MAG: tRNA (N6-isopentenyl adenosine(37)-C2)-methylthiotransferase MiaB [Oligoflexia bacterium]|nr:tRNA (N6-isopentenyl adenosine(37)-C2)-methylthiotransferase MiaB [Oligoflexia bacterium]
MKKVFLKTYGCQMNEHDSERMLANLKEIDFISTNIKEEADLVLFNTCAIRDHANAKFYSHIGEIRALKLKRPSTIIAVGGCISQVEGEELLKRYPHIDIAFGPDNLHKITEMVLAVSHQNKKRQKIFDNSFDTSSTYSIKDTKFVHGNPKAYVTIMKGCDNYCSYCIVPYTRGREKSRPMMEVVDDVKRLVEFHGIDEVMLLGQNVNSFGRKENKENKDSSENFVSLLRKLEMISGLKLLRYTSSHPRDVSDELICFHGESKKLADHLHLPVQSGSNVVLEQMNRGYSVEHYLGLLEKLKKANPRLKISSDIIVGYPGESEEEYQKTLNFLQQTQFDFIYSYAFSPRPGTKAFDLPQSKSISREEKSKRLHHLQLQQLSIQEHVRREMIGEVERVLVDGRNKRNDADSLMWRGRASNLRIVHFNPREEDRDFDFKWKWVEVKITSSTALSSKGDFCRVC